MGNISLWETTNSTAKDRNTQGSHMNCTKMRRSEIYPLNTDLTCGRYCSVQTGM